MHGMSNNKRLPQLEGLRFVMCCVIIVSHLEFLENSTQIGGYVKYFHNPTMAVDYFFMLSGFGLCLSTKRPSITFRNCIRYAICKMAASTMYRKSPGALAAGGRCLIGCILSRLSGDKKTMRRSRNRKEAEKVKIP